MAEKNSKQLSRLILRGVLSSGMFVSACGSPTSVPKILPEIAKMIFCETDKDKNGGKQRYKLYNAFNYLRYRGLIEVRNKKGKVYIFLTKEGKKLAEKYKIDDLAIKKPKKWDRLWRILIFDIKEGQRAKRDALRGKIKELGLYQLQKSIWVCPYAFFSEIKLLREFFDLDNDEMNIITAYEIENDVSIKKYFGLR